MNELNIKIEILQNDIQKIIDKKKNEKDKTIKNLLDSEKKEKLVILEKYSKEFKNLKEIDRANKKKNKEINKVTSVIDSLIFQKHKKKGGNMEAKEQVNKHKIEREKSIQEFHKMKEYEREYYKYDDSDYPGFIFMHDTIINSYNICPFLNINTNNDIIDNNNDNNDKIDNNNNIDNDNDDIDNNDNIDNNNDDNIDVRQCRMDWLHKQFDNGKLYYDLKSRLIDNVILNDYIKELQSIEEQLENHIYNSLSDVDYTLYKSCVSNLYNWKNNKVKSKRLKENFKKTLEMLYIIESQNSIHVHKYLEYKYSTSLIIQTNNLNTNVLFDDLLSQYNKLLECCKTEESFILNVTRNLNEALYKHIIKLNNEYNSIERVGKYCKKWALLKPDERRDRVIEFCKFYINSTQENPQVNEEDNVRKIEKLTISLMNKDVKLYKLIKWNDVKGIIESIKDIILDENGDYVLKVDIRNKISNVKKSKSKKTIFIKENNKIINELLLRYILKNNPDRELNELEYTKILDLIKLRLQKKKIWGDDKNNIKNRFLEIYDIINTNNPAL